MRSKTKKNKCDKFLKLMWSRSSVEGKRKRKVTTLETKLKVIEQFEKEKSQRAMAEQFNLAKSMISDIWKDREKIKKHVLIQSSL